MSFKRISFLLGLASLALAFYPLSAQAETLPAPVETELTTASLEFENLEFENFKLENLDEPENFGFENFEPIAGLPSDSLSDISSDEQQVQAAAAGDAADLEVTVAEPPIEYVTNVEPVVTTALGLSNEISTTPLPELSIAETHTFVQAPFVDVEQVEIRTAARVIAGAEEGAVAASTPLFSEERVVAQAIAQQVEVGQATLSGPSYIGIGGNVGLASSDTTIGRAGFAVLSKIGLTPGFSARPSVIIDNDDVGILLPFTFDFAFQDFADFQVGPFLGAGLAIETAGDFIGLLLTAGVDVPFSPQFTGTVRTHVSIFNEAAVGIMLGVGYNIGPALFQ